MPHMPLMLACGDKRFSVQYVNLNRMMGSKYEPILRAFLQIQKQEQRAEPTFTGCYTILVIRNRTEKNRKPPSLRSKAGE